MAYDQDKVNSTLAESKDSEFEKKILTLVNGYLRASSDVMSKYWTKWDKTQALYQGYVPVNNKDTDAKSSSEPSRIIIPMSFAQLQTAAAFTFAQFTQKDRFFELNYRGPNKSHLIEALETDLAFQTGKTKLPVKVVQQANDVLKFGFGVYKCHWDKRTEMMRVRRKEMVVPILNRFMAMFGRVGQPVEHIYEAVEEVLTYEGNEVTNVSPYCFFPDVTLPLSQFQQGQYCGHEELKARSFVNSQEGITLFGVKHARDDYKKDAVGTLGGTSRKHYFDRQIDSGVDNLPIGLMVGKAEAKNVIYTEVQVKLIPRDFKGKLGNIDLGDETRPITYLVVILNDDKIVRFQPLNYLHGQFTYTLSEYNPDQSTFLSNGLSDYIDPLQDVSTWLINSHIANVRKVIRDRILYDPQRINSDDVKNNREFIRTTEPVENLDRVFKQLSTTDVTSSHIGSANAIHSMIQMVTGITDNALGVYSSGRRSAYEARQVTQGASVRLNLLVKLIWMLALEPLGQQMIANTRQNRSLEVYNSIVGDLAQQAPFDQVILTDPSALAMGYDFIPYDATSPSEKQNRAVKLSELFAVMAKSPEMSQVLGADIRKLLMEILELYGITDWQRWMATESQQPVQAQVLPDQQVMNMNADGNLQQLSAALGGLQNG